MRYFLISDNHDTAVGMRLAGIDGLVLAQKQEVLDAIDAAVADPEVGVLLISERLSRMCADKVLEMKLELRRPLIVEIPDRHGTSRNKNFITNYIKEAIGIKID